MKNKEIDSKYGKISHIGNVSRRKFKLNKFGIAAMAVAAGISVGSFLLAKHLETRLISDVPEDQICITVKHFVSSDDDLDEIANMYYSDDCKNVYNNFENYERSIRKLEENKGKVYGDDLVSGNFVTIPVIIDKDNPYYVEILKIQDQIKEIDENEFWVDHVTVVGESLYSLASLASIDEEEILSYVGKIKSENADRMYGDFVPTNVVFKIINPELRELKQNLRDLEEQLRESLITQDTKSNYNK